MVNLNYDSVIGRKVDVYKEVIVALQPLFRQCLYNFLIYHLSVIKYKNERLLRAPHSAERVQRYNFSR